MLLFPAMSATTEKFSAERCSILAGAETVRWRGVLSLIMVVYCTLIIAPSIQPSQPGPSFQNRIRLSLRCLKFTSVF